MSDDPYRTKAKGWITAFYNCDTTEEQNLILDGLVEENLEVLRFILLDTTLYSSLYHKDNPVLLSPPAGYKGRS